MIRTFILYLLGDICIGRLFSRISSSLEVPRGMYVGRKCELYAVCPLLGGVVAHRTIRGIVEDLDAGHGCVRISIISHHARFVYPTDGLYQSGFGSFTRGSYSADPATRTISTEYDNEFVHISYDSIVWIRDI